MDDIFVPKIPESDIHVLRVIDTFVDSVGIGWSPFAGWAIYPANPATGYPWQMMTLVAQTEYILVEDYWLIRAFASHLITGLYDRHEHSFDNFKRLDDSLQMLPKDYILSEVADLLNVNMDVANQFLFYRSIYTRIPKPLLDYFFYVYIGEEDIIDVDTGDTFETCLVQWQIHESGYHGNFSSPAPIISPILMSTSCDISIAPEISPTRNEAMVRALNLILTYNAVPWNVLYEEKSPGELLLKPDSLALLRKTLISDEDLTSRIGTIEEGMFSDASLRLVLRARVMNAVGPRNLWAQLGLWEDDGSPWELPVDYVYTPAYHKTDGRI